LRRPTGHRSYSCNSFDAILRLKEALTVEKINKVLSLSIKSIKLRYRAFLRAIPFPFFIRNSRNLYGFDRVRQCLRFCRKRPAVSEEKVDD